jgi:hypothetical protein
MREESNLTTTEEKSNPPIVVTSEAVSQPRITTRKVLTAFFAVLYIGFFSSLAWHKSETIEILGRYSARYGFLLLSYMLLFIPFVKITRSYLGKFFVDSDREGKRSISNPILKILVCAIPVLLILLPLEMYLRLNFGDFYPDKDIRAFHPFLQGKSIPGDDRFQINSHGFRGEEISLAKPEGTFRIFFLGGSTVFAGRQPYDKLHTRILEKSLRAAYPDVKIEIQNAAFPWYTSQHSLINYLIKIKDFDPDLIVVWHGINDLSRSFSSNEYTYGSYKPDHSHMLGPAAPIIFKYFRPPPLVNINMLSLEYMTEELKSKLPSRTVRGMREIERREFESLKSFERNMTSLILNARLDGVKVILGTQPTLYREGLTQAEQKSLWLPYVLGRQEGAYPSIQSMEYGMNLFNEKTISLAHAHEIPLIDLASIVPKTGEYLWDGCHYTAQANTLIAETLFDLNLINA